MKAVSLGTDDIDEAERIACAKFMPIVLTTSEEIVAAYAKNARQLGGASKASRLAAHGKNTRHLQTHVMFIMSSVGEGWQEGVMPHRLVYADIEA